MARIAFALLALCAVSAYAYDTKQAADSEGLVSSMLRSKWNKTKYDSMDAVVEAQDLDSASEEFMIAALMKKLAAYKNISKFTSPEQAQSETLVVKALLSQLIALKRNASMVKFSDLEAMDVQAADEVLLSKLFSTLSAWKSAKMNMTKKFSASEAAKNDEMFLSKLWAMVAAKKNKTFFSADASIEGANMDANPEFLLSAIYNKLAAWKNKTRFSAPDAASDETLLSMLYAKLAAKKNVTGAWGKKFAADESTIDDAENNEYFMMRLNKTAVASSIATKFNMTAKTATWNKTAAVPMLTKNKTMWG